MAVIKIFFQHIKEIQSSGTFYLVGLSWGGAITLEIARLLEKAGQKTRVILIDGAPDTLQATVQQLTEDGNFNVSLISSLLQVKVRKYTCYDNFCYYLRKRCYQEFKDFIMEEGNIHLQFFI